MTRGRGPWGGPLVGAVVLGVVVSIPRGPMPAPHVPCTDERDHVMGSPLKQGRHSIKLMIIVSA